MSTPSNVYAEKIFAEHPVALWALDDSADYISLLNDNHEDLTTWEINDDCSVSLELNPKGMPFENQNTYRITAPEPVGQSGSIVCVSEDVINFPDLNIELGTFTIGTHVYALNSSISSVEIGYEYYDTTSGETVQKLKRFDSPIYYKWFFISETFTIPSEDASLRLVLKINYLPSDPQDGYNFLINGISFGQWAEEFNATSLGVKAVEIPSEIGLNILHPQTSPRYGVKASAYGLQDNDGYYMVSNNGLLAKNSGVPMVFGASNITRISPNNTRANPDDVEPSLVLPGMGFLNNSGKYRDLTAEMWLRVTSDTQIPKRIFGPIASLDGLYVHGPFLQLKISDKSQSYYVGEWTRPMLVHIRYSSQNASLLINGEQVISISLEVATLDFPEKMIGLLETDWLGFYAYEDVDPVEIDCFAIYPYKVPEVIAKRRFVYGQGVEFPENINESYDGTSVFIDYSFSKYTNNYSYPDNGNWNQAIVSNLSTQNNVLSLPDYSLPSIRFNNKTETEWYADIASVQDEFDKFIKIRPDTQNDIELGLDKWSETSGHLFFNKLNVLTEDVKCFFGVFKTLSLPETEETLMKVYDSNTGNYLLISVLGSTIYYKLKYFDTFETIYTAPGMFPGEKFAVGIDIDIFSEYHGTNVSAFLGNASSMSLYIGGNEDFTNTFNGNIYKIGFANKRNLSKTREAFNFLGVPLDYENIFPFYSEYVDVNAGFYNTAAWEALLDGGTPQQFGVTRLLGHISSYGLIAKNIFDEYSLDIEVESYWEDYIPLTSFAKYVTKESGSSYYDLDFLQFNLSFPAPSIFKQSEESSQSWKYQDLQAEFGNPVQRNYESLDNHLFTGYENYLDLKNRSQKSYSYDTSLSILKSYISFQYLATGANAHESFFTSTVNASKDGIVTPGTDWATTKYEVVDNMIIYPPVGVDFKDLAIVTHLEFNVDGIFEKPIKIKSLQFASQSFSDDAFNPIGTRFGSDIFPYKKTNAYFDYKSPNPFSIYKRSTPYLYMTRNTGIKLRGQYDPLVSRGLSIPVNKSKSASYSVMAFQAAIRYDEDFFPYTPTQIFEVQSKDNIIKFYLVSNHPDGKRAKIFAVNGKTGAIENGIGFYLNGKIVKNPVISIKEWAFIGVSFAKLLNFNSYVGAIRITGPVLVNSLSYYESIKLQEVQRVTRRPWFKVRESGQEPFDWDYRTPSYLWSEVLILSSINLYGANPSQIYNAYMGTNKIIVEDDKVLTFNKYEYSVSTGIQWETTVHTAL